MQAVEQIGERDRKKYVGERAAASLDERAQHVQLAFHRRAAEQPEHRPREDARQLP